MSKKKLSAKNILILSGTTAGLGASISLSVSYLTGSPFWTIFAWANALGNLPLLLSSSDALRQELGLRSPIQIIGSNSKAFGRKIPISVDGKQSNIFMQTLRLSSGSPQEEYEPTTINTVSVWYDENEHTLTTSEIEEFIYVAWRRQGQKKNGFSRQYWTRQRRPRLKTLEYNVRMWTLMSCEGLVINRSEGRSGKLSVPPDEAIKIIRSAI
jgi:hypothetical protein